MPPVDTKKATPPPELRYNVFISSTNDEGMREFRKAAESAIVDVRQVPVGMERFEASTARPIEKIYEEIGDCQIAVFLMGNRYGSICAETSLSYTESEFNEAESKSLSILAFEQTGQLVDPAKTDLADMAKQKDFKDKIRSNRIIAQFQTPDELQRKVAEALRAEIERRKTAGSTEDSTSDKAKTPDYMQDYKEGAKIFKRFILLPGRYNNRRVCLRVRVDGTYGTWRLKEELFVAFNMPIGNALYLNDLSVMGCDYRDIANNERAIDMFAKEDAADWLLKHGITEGSTFEGEFRLVWKKAKNIAGQAKITIGATDAYIAKLILERGIKVIPESEISEEDKQPYYTPGVNMGDLLIDLLK